MQTQEKTHKTILHEKIDNLLASSNSRNQSTFEQIESEIKKLPNLGVLKSEVESVKNKLLDSNPDDGVVGKPTMWKLSHAITAASNDIGGRRKAELDEIAGKLILG